MALLDRLRGIVSSTPAVMPKVGLLARLGRTNVAIPADQVIVSRPRFGGRPVEWSKDLGRVLALPRRPLPTKAELEALVEKWTAKLKTPAGTQRLRPVQALALEELSEVGGGLNPIGVGQGKTLIDMLAARVVPDCRAAVLMVKPDLRAQFFKEWKEVYGPHWQMPNLAGGRFFTPGLPVLHVVAYTELSSPKATDLLERLQPDLFILDECLELRRREAARTKRFIRYFEAHPTCRLAAWSGTLTKKSLRDYAHFGALALREGAPVPLQSAVVDEWASAIDPVEMPAPIGELRRLCMPGETARKGFSRRLIETKGVVATTDDDVDAGLVVRERKPGPVPRLITDAIAGVRTSWQRPDGEELIDALSVSRCARELSCGFFLRWRWPRGEPVDVIERWLGRRKDWHRELREKLKYGGEHLDSPLLCAKAAIRHYEGYSGELPTWRAETWRGWVEVRETAKPETEVVWLDEFLMRDAADWLAKHKGIAWYDSDAVGRKLAQLSGAAFFGPGPEASEKIIAETGDRPIIASIRSHGTGKNLQKAFSQNLIVQTPSSGATLEQLIGRTHRQGQPAEEVEVFLYRHTEEMAAALQSSIRDAEYIAETLGVKQKLCYATFTFAR